MAETNVEMNDSLDYEEKRVEDGNNADSPLEELQARAREIAEETAKLKQLQVDIGILNRGESSGSQSPVIDAAESDSRSIYIGNVDYGTTADELERHFVGCGAVNRVTIMSDKLTGHPKGFAYIEFADSDSVAVALAMDESLFRGRAIKVCAKRTNLPGIYTATNRPSRGQYRAPFRGRGSRFRANIRGGYGPTRRPRTRHWSSPY